MNIAQKVTTKLRRGSVYLYRDLKHALHLDAGSLEQARGSRILVYHGICRADHTKFNTLFLKLDTFEQHLQYYSDHFNVVTLDEYYQQKFHPDKFNVCITFDDGFANNHEYVLPLLEKYRLPATFFITAIRSVGYDVLWNDVLSIAGKYGPDKFIFQNEVYGKDKFDKYFALDSGKRLADILRITGFNTKAELISKLAQMVNVKTEQDRDHWLQMTEAQIREMSLSPYVTIGAHGVYHNDLAAISLAESIREMQDCKNYLESIIQKPVNSLAFPYGSYTPAIVDAAKTIGYQQLLPLDVPYDDPTLRERFVVNPFISVNNQMYATVNKRYE